MGFETMEIYNKSLYDGSSRVIAYLKKVTKTDKKYPRKYSIIKARPL